MKNQPFLQIEWVSIGTWCVEVNPAGGPHRGRLTGRLSAPHIGRVSGLARTSGTAGMSDGWSSGNYPVSVSSPRVIGAGSDGARMREQSMVGKGRTVVSGSVRDGERVGRHA